jgi:hypothetical protein
MKTLKTNKKFYNKWLYKVTLVMKGTTVLRSYALSDIQEYFSTGTPDSRPHSLLARAWPHKEELIELITELLSYDATTWTKRIEHSYIDFYTNDVNFYNNLSEKFENLISQRFEPDETESNLLEQPQVIITTKLPHNRYKYRVYLKPHKLAGDKAAKEKYVDWLKSQVPRITCTPAVERWFIKTDWNWDRRYVLVEDDNTLLMLKLRNSEVAGRVYNYVIADK